MLRKTVRFLKVNETWYSFAMTSSGGHHSRKSGESET